MATDVTEAPTTNVIGAPLKRVEDPQLVTGAGKYLDDLKLPGMAHVAIVRSPHAHARIRGIRTERPTWPLRLVAGSAVALMA